MPAPVVADALGYHHKTTTRAAAHVSHLVLLRRRPPAAVALRLDTTNSRQLITRSHQYVTPIRLA
jgi:hypothetical protein